MEETASTLPLAIACKVWGEVPAHEGVDAQHVCFASLINTFPCSSIHTISFGTAMQLQRPGGKMPCLQRGHVTGIVCYLPRTTLQLQRLVDKGHRGYLAHLE